MSFGNVVDRRQHLSRTLLASAARTAATGNGGEVRLPDHVGGVVFTLDVTAAATDNADKLDVFVQTKVDGTNWVDVVEFTQVAGDGGAVRYMGKISATAAETMFENATALTPGNVRNFIGDEWRVRWVITDASTDNASFTFSVTACPM